ncbi:MAG: hypothetical protein K2L24_02045 [Opitutales bacterium]|nr:hypothetical protein [Opitutales bacterium]
MSSLSGSLRVSSAPVFHPQCDGAPTQKTSSGRFLSDHETYGSTPCTVFSAYSEDDMLCQLEAAVDCAHQSRSRDILIIVDARALIKDRADYESFLATGSNAMLLPRFLDLNKRLKELKKEGAQILIISHREDWELRYSHTQITLQEKHFEAQFSIEANPRAIEHLASSVCSYARIFVRTMFCFGLADGSRMALLLPPTVGNTEYDNDRHDFYTKKLDFKAPGIHSSILGLFGTKELASSYTPTSLKKEETDSEYIPTLLKIFHRPEATAKDTPLTEIVGLPIAMGNVVFSNFIQKCYKERVDLVLESCLKALSGTHQDFRENKKKSSLHIPKRWKHPLEQEFIIFIGVDDTLRGVATWSKEQNRPFVGIKTPEKTTQGLASWY